MKVLSRPYKFIDEVDKKIPSLRYSFKKIEGKQNWRGKGKSLENTWLEYSISTGLWKTS
jgi:hypothetical protein